MWSIGKETVPPKEKSLFAARAAVQALLARRDLGFIQLPEREELWQATQARAKEIRKSHSRMIVLGMGGSSLGGRALIDSMKKFEAGPMVEFFDNNDSDRFWRRLKSIPDLQNTHWVLISKSGNTIETLSMAEFADQHLRLSGHKKLAHVATVITESRANPLSNWAQREGVAQLEIPRDVGGRFSVLSPVGLLPAAYYGIDLDGLREGAKWALNQSELVARLVAQSLDSFERKEFVTQFWAYSDGLKDFGLWIQQLWAESLGKAKDRKGAKAPWASTPIACLGAADQHSILQQVMEGQRDKFLWFLRVGQCESTGPKLEKSLFEGQELMLGKNLGQLLRAEALATQAALEKSGVQSVTLNSSELNAPTVGALFMLFELVVGAIGEALDINAFDQPGVELGKVLARELLSADA